MAETALIRTEFEFTLPRGYVDDRGGLHRTGTMRLAMAADEIEPLRDPRVHSNQSYLTVVLLSRVVTTLGDIRPVPPAVIERLFSADFAFLQDLYIRINEVGGNLIETQCPACGARFALDLSADQAG